MKKLKDIIAIIIFTIVLLLFGHNFMNAQTNLTVAQDFTSVDTHGDSHTLFNYLDSGKYVVLDFFFTTCGPCITSVPIINDAFTAFGCNTGEVIFLSIDNGDTDAEVIQYETDYGCLPPAISGNEGGGDSINSAYGIGAYPTVVLIAPDKTILEQDIWPVSGLESALLNANISQNSCTVVVSVPELNIQNNNKIFDVFGREWSDYESLPYGIYIKNNQKFIKLKN